jgi:hypothetical protein
MVEVVAKYRGRESAREREVDPVSFRKFSGTFLTSLVLSALIACSASAAVSTTAAKWFANGTALTETALGLTVKGVAAHDTFTTEIGTTKVHFTIPAVSCDATCVARNRPITSKAGAVATGGVKLRFESVSVVEPAGCTVTSEAGISGQILTKSLALHADWMDTMTTNKKAFVQFIPETGTTIAQFELSGGECAGISGKRNISGSFFAESKNNTGVESKIQELVFSPAVQSTSGGGLLVGTKPAEFTGTIALEASSGASLKIE